MDKKEEKTIRVEKKTIYSLFAGFIMIAVVLGYVLAYLPMREKQARIIEHKKALYESILCQFSCPLIDLTVMNETRLVPNRTCAQGCIVELHVKNISQNVFSSQELLTDSLAKDIDDAIQRCREATIVLAYGDVNYTLFFPCALEKLESLIDTYSYLR